MNNMKLVLCALGACVVGMVSADTTFLGGNSSVAGNWSNGLPVAGNPGTFNVDGTIPSRNQAQTLFSGATVTIGNGATCDAVMDIPMGGSTTALNLIVNNGTLTAADDIFSGYGTITFNTGSSGEANDDFEVQSGGTININGGTHTAGDLFGMQGSAGALNLLGGSVTAAKLRLIAGSGTATIGGDANVTAPSAGSLTVAVNIKATWTGFLKVTGFTGTEWQSAATAGWTLDGVAIDASMFSAYFLVTDGGATLSLNTTALDLPVFTADPIVKANGEYGIDYASVSQTLAGIATNVAGDTMTYSKVDGEDWLTVASDGSLSGIADVKGTNSFIVSAFDGEFSSTAVLQIEIDPLGSSPVFTFDTIVKADGNNGLDYSLLNQSLTNSATDVDGDTLSYFKEGGPAWLNIASNGALSGVVDTYGTNSFDVLVSDGNDNFDTATLRIYILIPTGGTQFQSEGGDLSDVLNWSNGLPGGGNDGVIGLSGDIESGNFDLQWLGPDAENATVTVNNNAVLNFNGTPSSVRGDFATDGADWIIDHATITCDDDFFVTAGLVTLNEGSVTMAVDDWEAQDNASRILVNGGTHSSGAGTGNNVGAQGNSARIGCGVDFRGGVVTAGNFRFQTNSVSSVGGSAVLDSAAATTTFNDAKGAIDILSGWTGSWKVGSFVTGDWEALVTNTGNGFTFDGDAIDSSLFNRKFSVSVDGTTLSRTPSGSIVLIH